MLQGTHLTQDTICDSDKNSRKHHILESQVASPFPAGEHKAPRNRQDSMTDKQKTQVTKTNDSTDHDICIAYKF